MRTTVIAAMAGFALLIAGCANPGQNGGTSTSATPSSTASASTSGTADPAKVKFAGEICGAVSKFLTPMTAVKPDTSSPAAAVTSLKTQLSSLSQGLTDATNDLKDADTSGVPDGQKALDDLRTTFGQIKDAVDRTRTKLDSVNVSDPQSVNAAIQDAGKELSGLSSMQNPLDQPNLKSADMAAAAEQAPECQKIKAAIASQLPSGSGTPTAPTTTTS